MLDGGWFLEKWLGLDFVCNNVFTFFCHFKGVGDDLYFFIFNQYIDCVSPCSNGSLLGLGDGLVRVFVLGFSNQMQSVSENSNQTVGDSFDVFELFLEYLDYWVKRLVLLVL